MALQIPNNEPLDKQKELVGNALTEAFAKDLITMEELEKRVNLVQGAKSNSEISKYVDDLPSDILVPQRSEVPSNPQHAIIHKTIMGSNQIQGKSLQFTQLESKVLMGEQILDYSKTVLEPGQYHVHVKVLFGDIKIVLPPEYACTLDIKGIIADIKDKTRKRPAPDAPEIIIHGKAYFASVIVKEKGSGIIEQIKRTFFD